MLKLHFPAKEWSWLSFISPSQREVLRPTWQLWTIRLIWKFSISPVSILHVQIQVPKLLLSDRTTAELPLSPATVTEIELLLCLELLQEKNCQTICCKVTVPRPLAVSVSATMQSLTQQQLWAYYVAQLNQKLSSGQTAHWGNPYT